MAIPPAILMITVLASSLPAMCAEAAISCAVKAGECWITAYLIAFLSRRTGPVR